MKITAHSAVEIGQRVKFTIGAMDQIGGASDSYRSFLSCRRGVVTDLKEHHIALVRWDGREDAEQVYRPYLEPDFCAAKEKP